MKRCLFQYSGLWVILFWLACAPVQAQQVEAPPTYPTLAALETTAIPAADPAALAQRLRGVTTIPAPPTTAPIRQVGERQNFWVLNSSDNLEFQVSATLRVVGEHIYFWVQDTAADGSPLALLDDDQLRALATGFDTRVYPRVRDLWGSEANPGVDGDSRIYGLFAYNLGSGTAAYFASRHTYPNEVYPTSNEHEMFLFNLDAIAGNVAAPPVESIVAHEFQHMIRANIQDNDAIWLNEGFSTFTQLYLYGDASAALDFLVAPQTQLNTWAEDGPRAPHYGAAVLFLAYFYERYGAEALRALSLDPGTGLESVERVLSNLGAPGVNELFADWTLANVLLDPTLADGRYGYKLLPAGLADVLPRETVSVYPYQTTTTANQYSANYTVLTNLDGIEALTIRLNAPEEVSLIPTEAASGRWLWYSNRGDMSDTHLTHAFDLTGVQAATLHYRAWYYLEDRWDYTYVMVSADDGATWDILSSPQTTEANPHSSAYGPGYTGRSDGWLEEKLPLDAYAGKKIRVRFEMITDDAINQPGFALDDVTIPEIGYASDFETDDGGWEAQGWLRMDNRLPQQTWVQAVQHVGSEVEVTRWLAPDETTWTLPLVADVNQVTLVVAPFAPVTTVPMDYTLTVTAGE